MACVPPWQAERGEGGEQKKQGYHHELTAIPLTLTVPSPGFHGGTERQIRGVRRKAELQ